MAHPDIVYILGKDLPDNGRELRYSLRSLSNVRHGRVWMVGPDIPDWVQGVSWIPWEQLPEKILDISVKYRWLTLGLPDMTDDVVVMDDDFYIVKKMRTIPLIYNMPMAAKAVTRPPDDEMGAMLRNTQRLLQEKGLMVPLAAVLHVPFPLTRSELPVHLEDGRGPYEWKTLYLNYAMKRGVKGKSVVLDPKITEPKDVPIALEHNAGFISSMERTYDECGLDKILQNYFPQKCNYET